jgi:hypothetical protein
MQCLRLPFRFRHLPVYTEPRQTRAHCGGCSYCHRRKPNDPKAVALVPLGHAIAPKEK